MSRMSRMSSRGEKGPAEPIMEPRAMLDVENDLEWPRVGPPLMLAEDVALARPPTGARTRSVRIWRWKRVPVAARELMGMSSCMCTVWACWRRLSRREKRRWQWHSKGRSPVCLRMCRARCSLRVKLRLHGGYSVQ